MSRLLKQILAGSNIFTAAKDMAGRYIYCNENVAEVIGLDSPSQINGKTDYELCWRNQAELYVAGDKKVIAGYPYVNVVEPQTRIDGVKKILISKSQVLNGSGKCVAVVGSYVDISNYFIKEKTFKLKSVNGKRFYLGEYFANEYLTRQEVRVLKMVLLGMGARQIAQNLVITQRTVETHINSLKLKLQCSSMGEVVMTALKTGLTFSVLDADNWDDI